MSARGAARLHAAQRSALQHSAAQRSAAQRAVRKRNPACSPKTRPSGSHSAHASISGICVRRTLPMLRTCGQRGGGRRRAFTRGVGGARYMHPFYLSCRTMRLHHRPRSLPTLVCPDGRPCWSASADAGLTAGCQRRFNKGRRHARPQTRKGRGPPATRMHPSHSPCGQRGKGSSPAAAPRSGSARWAATPACPAPAASREQGPNNVGCCAGTTFACRAAAPACPALACPAHAGWWRRSRGTPNPSRRRPRNTGLHCGSTSGAAHKDCPHACALPRQPQGASGSRGSG